MTSYLDLVIKYQALLERLKTGSVRDFMAQLKKLERQIIRTIQDNPDLSTFSRTRLNGILRQLADDQKTIMDNAVAELEKTSKQIAALSASSEIEALRKTVNLKGTKLASFSRSKLFSEAIKQPLNTNGDLLEPWIRDFTNRENRRVSSAIRLAHSRGLTNDETIRLLVGGRNSKGILDTTRTNAAAVTRTSIQHISSAAQHNVWTSNEAIVEGYTFLATLDTRTSDICREFDGQKFKFGEGPVPPLHPNCRSRTIATIADEFSFLSRGRTRSAEDGPTTAKTTYYEWLSRQTKAEQEKVLGPTKTKLFRDSGLSIERFQELQLDKNFEPLTIAQMRAMEPEAFKAAGL